MNANESDWPGHIFATLCAFGEVTRQDICRKGYSETTSHIRQGPSQARQGMGAQCLFEVFCHPLRNGTMKSMRVRFDVRGRKDTQAALMDLVRHCPERARAFDILCSIPGLGRVTAGTILVECPEIGTLSRKQIASLAGLAPMTRQSGQSRGRQFIQGGRKFLRDALYMPALVAARFNPDLRQRYQNMIKAGKPAKVALTALMRKLIVLANSLVQHDRKWTAKTA